MGVLTAVREAACIVRGRPAGLMLGLLLAKRGVDVLVLEYVLTPHSIPESGKDPAPSLGSMPPKRIELLSIDFDASYTHMYAPGTR